MSYVLPTSLNLVIVTLMLLVIIAENLKVTLPIALWSYFNNSNGLPELQMNLPSFMGYFNNSVFYSTHNTTLSLNGYFYLLWLPIGPSLPIPPPLPAFASSIDTI